LVKELQSLCLRVDLLTPDELSSITREEVGFGLTGLIEGEFEESEEQGEWEEKYHPKSEEAEIGMDDMEEIKEPLGDDTDQDIPLLVDRDEEDEEDENENM
jgi:hypothetical protein